MYSLPLGQALHHGQAMVPGKSKQQKSKKKGNLKKAILNRKGSK